MVKISVCLETVFTESPVEERIAKTAAAGFRDVEFWHPEATFDGRGLRFDVNIPKCILKPNGAIGLDDKKWLEVPMTLEALDATANTPLAPLGYYKSYENVA